MTQSFFPTDLLGRDDINTAIDLIHERRLNMIHCSQSGIEIGRLHETTIHSVVSMEYRRTGAKAERLAEIWEARHWAVSSRPSPMFLMADESSYRDIMKNTIGGHNVIFGYVIQRLLFPNESYASPEKLHFLRNFQERLNQLPGWYSVTLPSTDPAVVLPTLPTHFPLDQSIAARQTFDHLLLMDSIRSVKSWHSYSAWRQEHAATLATLREIESDDWSFDSLWAFVSKLYDQCLKWLDSWSEGVQRSGTDRGNRFLTNAALARMGNAFGSISDTRETIESGKKKPMPAYVAAPRIATGASKGNRSTKPIPAATLRKKELAQNALASAFAKMQLKNKESN